jgi:hypothetical protein
MAGSATDKESTAALSELALNPTLFLVLTDLLGSLHSRQQTHLFAYLGGKLLQFQLLRAIMGEIILAPGIHIDASNKLGTLCPEPSGQQFIVQFETILSSDRDQDNLDILKR